MQVQNESPELKGPSSRKALPSQRKSPTPKEDTFKEEGKATQESRSNLVRRRREGERPSSLAIDTQNNETLEMESIPIHSSGLDYSHKELKPKDPERQSKSKLTLTYPKPKKTRKDSNSSSSSFPNFQGLQQAVLSEIDQDQLGFDLINPTPDLVETARSYYTLVCNLNIHRVFFDPELEIVNRFCLEYTAICVKTESHGSFFSRKPVHYERVFKFMNELIDCISTPLDRDPHGPHVPVLLTKLFHNDFRIDSNGENRIGINVPLFSHSHRLSQDRFKSITDNTFGRKTFFLKRIDVSRHGLQHLA